MVVSLFARPWLAWLVCWVLFFWWMPLSIAVRGLSEAPITSNLVGTALASSPGELRNLTDSISPAWVFIFFAWNFVCGAIFIYLRKNKIWYWHLKPRIRIFVLAFLLLLVPYIFFGKKWIPAAPPVNSVQANDVFLEGDREIGFDADLPRAFPYELPFAIAQYWQARQIVSAARTSLKPLPYAHSLVVNSESPDVVVLVIGESSSRSAWRIFNPAAPETTPRLSTRLANGQGLYPFSNVVTQSTSTRQAVPSLLTPQPLLWPDGSPNLQATESIISLASRAGYESAWYSNQAAIGQFDGVVAAYANEAAVQLFLNPSSFFQRGTYDEVLLPVLQRNLARRNKTFIVLHTMGSHFQFEHRYPPGFGIFPEVTKPVHAYQNSIVYTDFMLDKIMEILEKDARSAIMVYVSDHGQGLPGDQCKKDYINRITSDSYEVPALIWLSPLYENSHANISDLLRQNALTPYTTEAIYQTLRDLILGYVESHSVEAEQRSPMSLLRPRSITSSQMIASPSQVLVNYKDAVVRNPCSIK